MRASRFIKVIILFAVSTVLSMVANAHQPMSGSTTDGPTLGASEGPSTHSIPMKNVKTMINEKAHYDGERISVAGAVRTIFDRKSFVIESGGGFNDKIIVLSTGAAGNEVVHKKDKIKVTGTLRVGQLSELKREGLISNIDPQVESQVDKATSFLVADEISVQR
jgi:hypothetical protein